MTHLLGLLPVPWAISSPVPVADRLVLKTLRGIEVYGGN